MVIRSHTFLLAGALCFLAGCGNKAQDNDNDAQQRTAVTLTHAAYGNISRDLTLSATTVYLNKSVVASPIPAFITAAYAQVGMRVRTGQLLYRLESKERHALGGEDNNGVVMLRATHSGIVLDVQQQAGSYVTEGTTLCTIADAGSLVFKINVPYEQQRYAHAGSRCTLELPDGTRVSATVQSPLATMDVASQSEQLIARARTPFLPEGMNVKALFSIREPSGRYSLIVPKGAVQSDEALAQYWVMKLTGDSTAVKVPVDVVSSSDTEVEISPGTVSPADKIINSGGYGLEDGAKVTVNQ